MPVRTARFLHRRLDRRGFLGAVLTASASAAATATGLSARSYARVIGANDAVRVGVVGVRSRGVNHLNNYVAIPGVRIAALCDVDARVLEERIARLRGEGHAARGFRDVRDLLADKEVDVVSLATPNHWHALGGIWALEAGKDVYVEKPVSHNLFEGRQLVRAAEKSGRIMQMGIQSRSGVGIARALEWARTKPLGRLLAVHGLCYNRRDSIGSSGGPQPVPTEIDYDRWCGPAPVVPPHRNRKDCGPVHYDWHWIWNYGNGDLGNQGVHQMDIARRFLGEPGLAPRVIAVGGRVGYRDDGETPNSMVIVHEYASAPLIFEVRGLPRARGEKAMDTWNRVSTGVVARYEHGTIVNAGYMNAAAFATDGRLLRRFGGHPAWEGLPEADPAPADEAVPEQPDAGPDHYANFIEAVRSRRTANLAGPILDGHVSSGLCHTANISHRLGRPASAAEIRDGLGNSPAAAEAFERLASHLAANGVSLDAERLTLGAALAFDPARECFVDSPAADAMRTREYRHGFEVREIA